ncbi:MvdC/MvdD family ATP grasp protein [Brasilonema octagenarum]|uniref:MvdC/MvdD family ATP grasp protein n=1 Tax=Brasilonema octagenarum TaxID=417105 RepID=UPI0032B7F5F7
MLWNSKFNSAILGVDYRLEYGNNSISTKQVQAVWMRRIWQPYLGEELAPIRFS